MRDIGDRDVDDKAAMVVRVRIVTRVDGIVVVAGIGGIDGEQFKISQIDAAIHRRRHERLRFDHDAFWKIVGNAVCVNGNQTDLAAVRWVAECFDDARLRDRMTAAAGEIEAHKVAVGGWTFVALLQRKLAQRRAIDGLNDAATTGMRSKDAQQAALLARQPFDGDAGKANRIAVIWRALDPCQHAIADADGRSAFAFDAVGNCEPEARPFGLLIVPHHRFGDQIAFVVAGDHFDNGDWRHRAGLTHLAAIARQLAGSR